MTAWMRGAAAVAFIAGLYGPATAQDSEWRFLTSGDGVEAFAGYDGFPDFNLALACVAPGAVYDRMDEDAPIAPPGESYNIFIGRDGFLGQDVRDGSAIRVRFRVDGRRFPAITFTVLPDGGDLLGVTPAFGPLADALRSGGTLEAEAIGFDGFGEAPLRGSSRAIGRLEAFCGYDDAPDVDDDPDFGDLYSEDLDRLEDRDRLARDFDYYDDLADGGLFQATVILTGRNGRSVRDNPILDFRTGLAHYVWRRGGRQLEVFFELQSQDRMQVNGFLIDRRGRISEFSEILHRRSGGYFRFAEDLFFGPRGPVYLQIELQ